MKCPRCESIHIRKSRSHDSVWRRLTLRKPMRCYRCCFVFTVPRWAQPDVLMNIPMAASPMLESPQVR